MANLFHVHEEWRTRPAHERYYDVADLVEPLKTEFENMHGFSVRQREIRAFAENDELMLAIPAVKDFPDGVNIRLNNWSFDQLSKLIDVSPRDLRRYPAHLVTPILQHQLEYSSGRSVKDDEDEETGIEEGDLASLFGTEIARRQHTDESRELQFLIAPNHTGMVARSVFSGTYGSYSDLKLVRDAMIAVERGWKTPRARIHESNNPYNNVEVYGPNHPQADRIATIDDVMKCSIIEEGDKIGPAGVYRGDRNIFMFLASDREVLPNLYRFLTIENGEDRTLRATFGLMNYTCSNHILWGVTNVHKISKKHRKGSVSLFRDEFAESLDKISRESSLNPALLNAAKQKQLGVDMDSTVKTVFEFGKAKQIQGLANRFVESAIRLGQQYPEDFDGASPFSVWGVVQGLTRASQSVMTKGRHYADKRQQIDRAAGMILDHFVDPKSVAVSVQGSDIPNGETVLETAPDGNPIIDVTEPKPATGKRGKKATASV